jgi:hypothetical protein
MRGSAIMAALPTALRELAEQAAFRVYITDTLFAMGNNQRLTQRYADLIKPRKIDNRSAEQIVDEVVMRGGIKIV